MPLPCYFQRLGLPRVNSQVHLLCANLTTAAGDVASLKKTPSSLGLARLLGAVADAPTGVLLPPSRGRESAACAPAPAPAPIKMHLAPACPVDNVAIADDATLRERMNAAKLPMIVFMRCYLLILAQANSCLTLLETVAAAREALRPVTSGGHTPEHEREWVTQVVKIWTPSEVLQQAVMRTYDAQIS
jgi:hypothetical protein